MKIKYIYIFFFVARKISFRNIPSSKIELPVNINIILYYNNSYCKL